MDGHQVPQQMVIEVGETFKRILKEVKQRATTSSPFFFSPPQYLYFMFLAGTFVSRVCSAPWHFTKSLALFVHH